mmetsp:Transcript_25045/g.50828  ORF Transcript_25045/g.50828 Transcript_25045/m.50828 type:complete len:209 (-) Transcript_25045:462-1088(-)
MEVWHHLGVLLRHLVAVLLQRRVRRERLELLDAVDADDRLRATSSGRATPVGLDGYALARLGGDGEANLGEVGELLARGALQREHLRVLHVRRHALDVLHGDAVVGGEHCQLVDSHVLEHALGVPLEALAKLLGLVRVVVHERRRRARCGLLELEGLLHVRRHVLVVAHVHGHALGSGVLAHLLQLLHGGRARLLEKDVRRARLDHLL